METEKVCVNLPAAELGKIDVLVAEGLFASRTDVVRSGIRTILDSHDDTLRRVVVGETRIGYQLVTRSELEAARRSGLRKSYFVVGVLRITGSIEPELADAAIDKIRIFGAVRAAPEVLARIEDRIIRGGENITE